MREVVPPALDGERLDRVVAMVADLSRADASRALDAGAVRVDGEVSPAGKLRLREGQVVEVDQERLGPRVAAPAGDAAVDVPIVAVDDAVIVVDKPAGQVVHPGSGAASGTLVNGLLSRFPELAAVGDPARPGIVHRLDKGTSGLLVVARTPAAYASLVAQLSARTVRRSYLALVWGVPEAAAGLVEAPIGRSPRDPTKMAVVAQGRDARTRYVVQDEFHDPVDVALLSCRLETGRTHQIRVHLAAIDHPVVGDATYGGARAGLALDRPFLHAAKLAFDDPITGHRRELSSPLPPDLARVLGSLRR